MLVSGQQLSSLTVGFSEIRAVGRSENPGGANIKVVAPLLRIGFTDLPKSGGGVKCPPPAPVFSVFTALEIDQRT